MRHQARLSTAVPHSTAFLPPAFIATLPPMHDASAEVGSTAKIRPARSAASDTRRVTTPASREDRRHWLGHFRQRGLLDRAERFELLGVDHRRERRERNRAAGVARAAAARNDRQPELDARAHQRRNLAFAVRREHDERIFDAPVGRVGHVRDARERIEADVVGARVPFEQSTRALAQLHGAREILGERHRTHAAPPAAARRPCGRARRRPASRRRSTSFRR